MQCLRGISTACTKVHHSIIHLKISNWRGLTNFFTPILDVAFSSTSHQGYDLHQLVLSIRLRGEHPILARLT
ncbi:hypothetical protein GJ744_009913 [Endocarpon pusillum]|uniref:Uncharacterized protein n=1 Tax=Endocarpon pusillum TaxID=364733 RepID=A0A8H7E5Y4_9EURO|nr:hypothetical protein GJ744_009913 [Endocarpon pusillum]